jgi:dTDP-4-amino-4,6-dideoxygalactose transaminase
MAEAQSKPVRIPVADAELGEPEVEAVAEVLRSRWLTAGAVCARFEEEFKKLVGGAHVLATTNCTAALHMAYLALDVRPGDEVLVPTLSFVATANAARLTGAVPVFVDCTSESDFNVDPVELERRIGPRTAAIAVVHYGGYPCSMADVMRIAARHGVPVVEDCAHAPGGTLHGKPVGTIGDVGCFSFFGNKNITTGEGGAVVTRRDDLVERLRLLRSHGMTTLTWDRHQGHASSYDVLVPGLNCRFDEMRAAIGLCQLQRLADNNARRARVVRAYRSALTDIEGLVIPFADRDESTFHLFPVVLPVGTDREAVMARLRAAGIGTSVHYPPTHLFTAYRGSSPSLPRAEAVAPRILTLPLYPALSDADVTFVVDQLKASIGR